MNEAVLQIAKRLNGLIAKRPGLVVGLWGEPGIGKTHTVKDLLRETPCRNLSLHATASLTEITRALPRPAKLPVWAERTLERVLKSEHVETASLTGALGAALSGLAPFIMHLEDIHEASPVQLEFINQLARVVKQFKGVGLIVTSRTKPPEPFESVRLTPLSSAEIRTVLELETRSPLPAEALHWIYARAAGNPLFTLEFFHFLARQGFVWSDGQRWRWRAPEIEVVLVTVEALFEKLLEDPSLSKATKGVLEAKAILGHGVTESLWAEVAQVSSATFRVAILELEARHLLLGDEFSHPLFKEIAKRNLSKTRHRQLSRRALEALSHDPQAAVEFIAGAELEVPIALEHLRRAVQVAGVESRAARYLAQAAVYATGDERVRLALEAAHTLCETDITEARRLAELALTERPGDPGALRLCAELLARQGLGFEAERLLEQLPESTNLTRLSERLHLRALARENADVLELYKLHPEILESNNPEIVSHIAWALFHLRHHEEAHAVVSQALEHQQHTSRPANLLAVLAIIENVQGHAERAEALFSEALEVYRKTNQATAISETLFNRARVLRNLGRFSEMMTDLEEAARLEAMRGDAMANAITQTRIAEGWLEFGEYQRAEDLLLESCSVLERANPSDFLVLCKTDLCLLYRAWEPPYGSVLALKHANDAVRIAQQLNDSVSLGIALIACAVAESWRGQPLQALTLADEALMLLECQQRPKAIAWARDAHARILEQLNRYDACLEDQRTAYRLAKGAVLPFETQRYGLELDRLNHDLESARERMHWFEKHGLMNGANIAKRYFPELTTDVPRASKIIQTKLEVFGTIQFVTGTSSLPVRGQKRRELLALLLEARIAGRRELSRLELLDVLYPNSDEMQAGTLLNDVIYQVREIGGSSSILTTENGYALGEITTDAETFLKHGDTKLWRGAYLEGLTLNRVNETAQETLHLALRSRAESLLETDPTEAARVGRLLVTADVYDLEALRLTLKALRALQNHKTLARVYTQSCKQFLEIGEVLPERWQDFLETQIGITA